MKVQIKYQYSPSGNGELLLTVDGKTIGKVYSKEHAEMIEQKFNEDTDELHSELARLEEEKEDLIERAARLENKHSKVLEKINGFIEILDAVKDAR